MRACCKVREGDTTYAKNRETRIVSKFFAKQAGRMSMENKPIETWYTGLRPKSSLMGANSNGPKASPIWYVVKPRATRVLCGISNSFIIPRVPEM